jgi:hypothetical protein
MLDEYLLQRDLGLTNGASLRSRRIKVVSRDPPDLIDPAPEEPVISAVRTQIQLSEGLGIGERLSNRLLSLVSRVPWHEHMFASTPDDPAESALRDR